MIDSDALIKNPERCKKNFDVFSQKIKKTIQKCAILAPKIRKASKKQSNRKKKRHTYVQIIEASSFPICPTCNRCGGEADLCISDFEEIPL